MTDPREDDEPISIEADAPEGDCIEPHQPVSDEDEAEAYTTEVRETDDDVSIESDTPEADWIEQHQPVGDEDEAEAYTTEVRETDDDVSIESDRPEADGIEQHQPIVDAPDEERLPYGNLPEEVVEAGELKQDGIASDKDVGGTGNQGLPTPPVPTGARGCNVFAAFVRAVLRLGCDAVRQVERRNRQQRD